LKMLTGLAPSGKCRSLGSCLFVLFRSDMWADIIQP
jgi:hypothetical protein